MATDVLKVAIVGAGPAGYYTAEALLKLRGDTVQIDLIDRLPTPYGLIRAGVAPDHQSIKNVAKRYEDTSLSPQIRFFGNVALGTDVSLAELRGFYDAVVLSVGAPQDKPVGVAGEHLAGVYGSAEFVGWYNGHPDFRHLDPDLTTENVIVIGNGNVAIDVARVLVKSPEEMAESDLAQHAAALIHASAIKSVTICGRRGPLEVSFSPKELGELAHLHRATTVADPAQMPAENAETTLDPGQRKVVQHIRNFAATAADPQKAAQIRMQFFAKPVAILGTGHIEAVRFERTEVKDGKAQGTGAFFELPCGLLVACIGYKSAPLDDVAYDFSSGHFQNQDGLIEGGLYCAGWARRGPTGTIGTNKPDGASVAERVAHEVSPGNRAGREGLQALLTGRGVRHVSFEEWKKIEMAEIDAAQKPSPRAKIVDVAAMLRVAHKN
jgi:NADPH-dependent glutamate synthase beta subunit-like oxidoreductase